MTSPAGMQRLQAAMTLPGGKTLKDVMPAADYAKADSVTTAIMGVGLALPQLAQLSPSALVTNLTTVLYVKRHPGFNPMEQLDTYFQTEAQKAGKKVRGLETLDFQIDVLFGGKTMERQVEELMCFVNHVELNADLTDSLSVLYERQDIEGLVRLAEAKQNTACDPRPEELDRLVGVLQTFDPRGIGARSLRECLHLQLTDPDFRSPYKKEALAVVDKYFDDFIHKHWETLCRKLGVDEECFGHIKTELLRLNPRPGNALGENEGSGAAPVVPDFIVTEEDGEPVVHLNNGHVPELHVSRAFRDSLREYDLNRPNLSREQRDAYLYAKKKVEAAQGFIDAIHQRQHTLMSVMQVIVDLQRPFFEDGDEVLLRPMILKDVADRAGVDISTVSRVTGSKYVQTDFGVYPLKFFFSNAVTTDEGEEHSTRKIKLLLREMIEHEDKRHPLTDENLAAMLAEKGLPVARRTVAKYREQLGLPVARLRR